MEKNVSIENYKPDFAVEAAYDLTVADLKKQGIKAVLVDLDNTLIAWNNPDGTPEMRQWLHDLVMEGFGLSWCLIIVPNGSSALLRNLILTMKPGRSSPLPLGLIGPSNVSTMRKMKWSWSGIN